MRFYGSLVGSVLFGLAWVHPGVAAPSPSVFSRLLHLTAAESTGEIAGYVLRETEIGKRLVQEILRATPVRGHGTKLGNDLVESAIRRLRSSKQREFAEALEQRLKEIDDSLVRALEKAPDRQWEPLLIGLAERHLKFRVARTKNLTGQPGEIQFLVPRKPRISLRERNAAARAQMKELERRFEQAMELNPRRRLDQILELYHQYADDVAFSALVPKAKVLELLANVEMARFTENFRAILNEIPTSQGVTRVEKFKNAAARFLKGKVPQSSIPGRIQELESRSPEGLRRILGDMSLEEVQVFIHGGNPLAPTPESLLGQYIRETGAKTVVRSFSLGPEKPGQVGPKRLVVALSADSFEAYQRLLQRPELMSVFAHAKINHNGKVFSYMSNGTTFRVPSTPNTVLPQVLLKPTEAQRLEQFFQLFVKRGLKDGSWDGVAINPWKLQDYCAKTGYDNCTHWIGNIPIGDDRVLTYAFPGKADSWATHSVSTDPIQDALPRIQPLMPYKSESPLIKRVWKVPGNRQFADVIGQQDANLRGDFASPGWVITTLLGPTSIERVPVVFVVVRDHRAALRPNFKPHFEEPF